MRTAVFEEIFRHQKKNKKIVFIGSDLGPGFMSHSKDLVKNRFFMEGVSEQHVIGMAAGMALEGYIPYVNTISTFLTRRCFEQIVVDLCLQNLPVKLIGNGGGLVYGHLGPTHQAIEDISILRAIPNMTIIAPCDKNEMRNVVKATVNYPGPIYIRLSKGDEDIFTPINQEFKIGKGVVLKEPGEYLFITTGISSRIALYASKKLEADHKINCGVLHLPTVKPLDKEKLMKYMPKVKKIITVEENVLYGGFGSSILEFCNTFLKNEIVKIERVGLKDEFVDDYGDQESLLKKYKITEDDLYSKVLKLQNEK